MRSQASYTTCHNPVPALQKGRGFPWGPSNSLPHRMAPLPLQLGYNLRTRLYMQGIKLAFPEQLKLIDFFPLWGCQRQHSWENFGSLTQSTLILIPATTLIQFISPDSMIQSGREFLVLILLFSECVHPAHNRKSSTSIDSCFLQV